MLTVVPEPVPQVVDYIFQGESTIFFIHIFFQNAQKLCCFSIFIQRCDNFIILENQKRDLQENFPLIITKQFQLFKKKLSLIYKNKISTI